jgi:hypothetical protein
LVVPPAAIASVASSTAACPARPDNCGKKTKKKKLAESIHARNPLAIPVTVQYPETKAVMPL